MRDRATASSVPSDASVAAARYGGFLEACRADRADFRLTPRAEPSAYARCFGIFGLHLIGATAELDAARDALVGAILRDLRAARASAGGVPRDKGYRQLLCFTLSALSILDALREEPLAARVEEQLARDQGVAPSEPGALGGRAQSGNQAMFLAIFLLHAREILGIDTSDRLHEWVDRHIEAMNRFGFWGPDAGPTHLHFQNGYHQYEIFEYLGIENPGERQAVATVAGLADPQGHFAPYPGGGGCFDYDAVFVLTPDGRAPDRPAIQALLRRTAATIVAEQQADGGFCDSLRIRPRRRALTGYVERLASARNPALVKERLRYALTLQRPKHDRVHTHWGRYHWRWDESDLWDSWFRMLTLARIECAFDPGRAAAWGFIDYPGIGWHPSRRRAPGP